MKNRIHKVRRIKLNKIKSIASIMLINITGVPPNILTKTALLWSVQHHGKGDEVELNQDQLD
jgi:hypothetical protein